MAKRTKNWVVTVMQSTGYYGSEAYRRQKSFFGKNLRALLKEAKAYGETTFSDRFKLDRIEAEQWEVTDPGSISYSDRLIQSIAYEYRVKGSEFIGMRGNVAPFTGWFNLSK